MDAYYIATAYAGLGDREQTLSWLEKGYEEHSPGMVFLRTDPLMDSMLSDPRYIDLMRRVGFP